MPMMLTRNFSLEEFRCKDGTIDHEDQLLILAVQLQALRDHIGVPIIIISGYRSPEYNVKIGGAKDSFHVKGMAADIRTKYHTPRELYSIIESLIKSGQMKQGGLGLYNTFVQYDHRGYEARW